MTKPPLDFKNVEALRKHMLLTTANIAKVIGVSRVTYSGWVNGKPMRQTNDDKVRSKLRRMLVVMSEQDWPSPEVIAMTAPQRIQVLLDLMPEPETAPVEPVPVEQVEPAAQEE